jgi:RNA recognition motif-containing protein
VAHEGEEVDQMKDESTLLKADLNTLCVGPLPVYFSEDEIENIFSKYGKIKDVFFSNLPTKSSFLKESAELRSQFFFRDNVDVDLEDLAQYSEAIAINQDHELEEEEDEEEGAAAAGEGEEGASGAPEKAEAEADDVEKPAGEILPEDQEEHDTIQQALELAEILTSSPQSVSIMNTIPIAKRAHITFEDPKDAFNAISSRHDIDINGLQISISYDNIAEFDNLENIFEEVSAVGTGAGAKSS